MGPSAPLRPIPDHPAPASQSGLVPNLSKGGPLGGHEAKSKLSEIVVQKTRAIEHLVNHLFLPNEMNPNVANINKAFDVARKEIENKHNASSNDITGEGGLGKKHPFVNSILGTFMDHLKGNERKVQGKSNIEDFKDRLKAERTKQLYWK